MVKEPLGAPGEYKLTNPSEYTPVLRRDPLWYLHPTIAPMIVEYFVGDNKDGNSVWMERRREIWKMFSEQLQQGLIFLGEKPEGFNDNDRVMPPHTVVIHHTHTAPNLSYADLNALHLLRLYAPVYLSGTFDVGGTAQPIASGHYYQGKQTFVGYHYLIRSDGEIEQILKDEYTGFHAGDYPTNCGSIGISIVDQLLDKTPSDEVLNSVAGVIRGYEPKHILGHREVIVSRTGNNVDTSCPGNRFLGDTGWKQELINRL